MKTKPIIVSLGEPFGCNVELCVHSLNVEKTYEQHPVVIVGSKKVWERQLRRNDASIDWRPYLQEDSVSHLKPGVYFHDIPISEAYLDLNVEDWTTQSRGMVAKTSLEEAVKVCSKFLDQGEKSALVTGPIDKKAMREAGFSYPGHTEYLSEVFHTPTLMVLAGPKLKVALVTNHLALNKVSSALTQQLINNKALLLSSYLKEMCHISRPKIAVTGLNPHCSDGGLFGNEESGIISPAVADLKEMLGETAVEGPLPADTVFYKAYQGGFDAVLAMYHDQALGPLKTVHFDEAINVTAGLPIIRVSPDHGPVTDQFLKNSASPNSWRASLVFAAAAL